MHNKSIFKNELNMIANDEYREFISKCLDNVPNYFWEIPASSSGKYHPYTDLGEGGLVRHTKACVQVGLDLLKSEMFVADTYKNRDIVIGSLLLHDCVKNDFENTGHTEFLHPLFAKYLIDEVWLNKLAFKEKTCNLRCYILTISYCIESHMGKWNTNKNSNLELPKPITELETLVHIADYIASRKYTDMNLIRLFEEDIFND